MDASFDQLVAEIEAVAPGALDRVEAAVSAAQQLSELGDQAVDHFIDESRSCGHSWAEIGERLGVTRQAVQRRFGTTAPQPSRPRRGARSPQEHHGKYRALWQWLRAQRADSVELSFSEIEQLLGFPLPPSCRRHQPHWYSYEGSAVVRAIVDAGWKAANVNLDEERARFVRKDP